MVASMYELLTVSPLPHLHRQPSSGSDPIFLVFTSSLVQKPLINGEDEQWFSVNFKKKIIFGIVTNGTVIEWIERVYLDYFLTIPDFVWGYRIYLSLTFIVYLNVFHFISETFFHNYYYFLLAIVHYCKHWDLRDVLMKY